MFALNSNDRFPSGGPKAASQDNRLTERVRRYFDRHPEVSRDEFLLEALSREIDSREQSETSKGSSFARREGRLAARWSTRRSRPSPEEIRMHLWLSERLATLHRKRHGLWPKLERFLFGSA
jgi:hypothetical protein